jgi:hypothetical protein
MDNELKKDIRNASSFPACLLAVDPKLLNGVLICVVGRSSLRVAEEAVRRIDMMVRGLES